MASPKPNRSSILLDVLLGVVLPLVIGFILLLPIMLPRGVPFYGDETYYYVGSRQASLYHNLFQVGSVSFGLFSYIIPLQVLFYLLGKELAAKLYILFVSSLLGILTYFAIKILVGEFFDKETRRYAVMASVVGGLFYMLAFSNDFDGGVVSSVWAYSTFPISLALLIRFVRKGSYFDLLCLGVFSVLGNAFPIWIYLLLIPFLVYLVFQLATEGGRLLIVKRSLIALATVVGFNAFWMATLVGGYIVGAGGIFHSYTSQKLISYGGLRFLSFWNLLNVVMVGENSHYYFWHHPQNYGPLNVVIPVLAATSILVFRKKKEVLYFGLILLVGIFLAKGVNPPAGYIYYIVAKSLPLGAGAILRNPPVFASLANFSYSFLIGITVVGLYQKLRSVKPAGRPFASQLARYCVTACLVVLVLSPVAYGTLLDLQGYTWTRFRPTDVPPVYSVINSWLAQQPGDFNVMWIPSGGGYVWKPYVITAFPDLLSSKPTVSFFNVYPEPLASTQYIGKLLGTLGVKYVVYHGDSVNYPVGQILEELLAQKDLRVVYWLNYTYMPENNSDAPLPVNQPGYVFSQSPFSLVGPKVLPRGETVNLELYYRIPDQVVREGYKGAFWVGFNIGLNGFPAGSTDLNDRVFWAGVSNQSMLNETAGYAAFQVYVPNNYPGTAIDLYAYFYDGGFTPLTPSYFVARLPVQPSGITIPFIVFENEDYNGTIYAGNLALAYGVNTSTLLNSEYFNPTQWALMEVGGNPVPQNLLDAAQLFIYSNSSLPGWLEGYLANSNLTTIYILAMSSLNLPKQQAGPYDPSYYVYNYTPLIPVQNVTFTGNKSVLVTFRYQLPQPVVEAGYQGRFWAGFGIRLWGYPHGVAPPIQLENQYTVFSAFIDNFTLVNQTSGYVTFNVSIPSSFQGEYVDLYANFYDGGFRPISPLYFVGSFEVEGANLVVLNNVTVLHLLNYTYPLNVYVPRSGEYVVAAKYNGTLSVDGERLAESGGGGWGYALLGLQKGNNVLDLSSSGQAYIEDLLVFGGPNPEGLPGIFDEPAAVKVVDYRMVNPAEWEVTLNASKPTVLVFPEPYDNAWRAYVDGRVLKPIPLYGAVNGFYINQTGTLHIEIYYVVQNYFYAGSAITTFTAAILVSYIIKKRKSGKPTATRV